MRKQILVRAVGMLFLCTFVCGGLYTLLVTLLAQWFFPWQADGSLISVPGGDKTYYGSLYIAQPFALPNHLWGREMILDTKTYRGSYGQPLLYAGPSNQSPASAAYGWEVAQRVARWQKAHPEMEKTPIPVDLVTVSGSGIDPEISPAAAEYQVKRLSRATGRTETAIREILASCTKPRFLGVFGEPRVNVLQVNLMLDQKL